MADKLPVGDTIDNLKTDGQKLVQDSKALVTAEIKPAAKHAGIGVGMFGGAGYFGIWPFKGSAFLRCFSWTEPTGIPASAMFLVLLCSCWPCSRPSPQAWPRSAFCG